MTRDALFLNVGLYVIDDQRRTVKVTSAPTAAGHGLVKIGLNGRKILARKHEPFKLA
jgi:hypothetical protein